MVRKIWIASMLVALTGAGFSLNYLAMASVPVQEKAKDRIITVTEQGKTPRKCKVLRSWNTPEGLRAFHVEALDNGEYLTVVTQKENSLTKIYHWQNHKTPPKNCPFPPEQSQQTNPSRIVEAMPAIQKNTDLPMQTAVNTNKTQAPPTFPTVKIPESKPSVPTEFVTIPATGADKIKDVSEGKKNALAKVPVKKPETPKAIASTQNPSPLNFLQIPKPTSDKVIVIKEEKTLVKTEVGEEKVIAVSPLTPKKTTVEKTTEVKVANTTPVKKAAEPAKIQVPAPKVLETKTVGASKPKMPEPAKEITPPQKPVEKVIVENPKAQDWRKSWGKMDEVAAKPAFKPKSDVELPHADTSKPDPLKTPDQFHPNLEEKVARRAEKVLGKDNGKKELEKITSPTPTKTTAQLAEGQPPRTIVPTPKTGTPAEKVVIIHEDATPRARKIALPTLKTPGLDIFDKTIGRLIGLKENAPRPFANAGKFNLGTRSVADSGHQTEFAIPYGQMGRPPMPMAFMPPPAPPINIPQAPQIYPDIPAQPTMIARAPTQGMANAFTDVPNQRPIPADMEATVNMQNAFQEPFNPEQQMQVANAQATARALAYQNQGANHPYAQMPSQVNPYQAVVVEQMVVLKTSLHPSQREFAADQLGQALLRGNPEVIQTLFHGVRNDPAPTVRAACIRSLTRMKIHTIETMDLFRGMKSDQDPRVRLEADKALIQQTSASR